MQPIILDFSSAKYNELAEEIFMFREMEISARRKLSGKLNSIRVTLQKLEHKTKDSRLVPPEEGTEFFKVWKPPILAQHLSKQEEFELETKAFNRRNETEKLLFSGT